MMKGGRLITLQRFHELSERARVLSDNGQGADLSELLGEVRRLDGKLRLVEQEIERRLARTPRARAFLATLLEIVRD
jgi:hypothetical protein